MTKSQMLSLLAAGASLVAITPAMAAPDTASDTKATAVFQKLDTDGDGRLTAAEMTGLSDIMAQHRLARMDSNNDGKVDHDEFMARADKRAEHMFKRMDRNGDSTIEADELTPPARSGKPGDQGDASPKMSHGHSRHGHHGWHHGAPKTDDIFAHMDRNNDGYVSADEWQQAAAHWHHGPGAKDHSSKDS